MKAPAAMLAAATAGLLLLVPGAAAAAVAVPAPAGCPADNCLRALRATQTPGRLAAAQSFCAAYTAATGTAAAAAPTVPAYAAAACASNHAGPLAARLSSACACIGSATATTTTPTASATEEPCALASSAWAAQTAANPTAVPTIAAALAEACLASAPLDAEAALALVDAIEPYLEWQSDAAYKAKPPADYYYPAYDMFAALAAVRAKVAAGAYAGEAAFQRDLYVQVFGQGHDGHMVFYPDLLTSVFDYGRGLALVSISDDAAAGAAPAIKLLADVRAAPATAPELERINGVPAAQYVQQTIDAATYNQDPDGAYNSMFYSPAGAGGSGSAGYWARGGRIRFLYPGAATNYTFANGSTVTVANEAYVRAPLTGVTDGASLFARFCAGARSPTGRAYKANSTAAAPSTAYAVPGYPAPVNSTSDGTASCYFLDGAGFEDVAVLALLSFEPAVPAEFQAVTHACLAAAVAAGRTRLVVDVSDNGGGYILLGYDFFRQLFPRTVQDGFSRWKANAGFAAVARVVSALSARLDPATSPDADAINLYESVFDARYDLDVADRPFASFADKFAPHVYADTPYTALMRWNLDDPLTTVNATFGMGMALSGYGPLANLSAPGLDDVVLLYDGVCASTCTLASEMLRLQGGVRAVALGGRPAVAGQPIQGVGGIKGAQVYQFSDIYGYAQEALALVQNGAVQAEDGGDTNATVAALARYSNLPIRRSTAAAINVRDQILRGNVADGLPAQYVREDADCRLYYTADMVADVTAGWRAAAHAAFRGGACAAGALPAPAAPAAAARSRRTQPKRAVAASAQAASAVLAAQAAAGFRPLDLAAADRARFDAEFNQKVIV